MSKCTLCLSVQSLSHALKEEDSSTIIYATLQTGFVLGVVAHHNSRVSSALCVDCLNSVKSAVADIKDDELRSKILGSLNLGLQLVKSETDSEQP